MDDQRQPENLTTDPPSGAGPETSPADAPDPRRWKALSVCLVAGFMTLLDVSIVNVALPSIQAGIDASPSDLQWVVSGYALALGLFLVPSGRTGDALGRRRMFITGMVVFTTASLLAGLAPTPAILVAARLLQGLGGGLISPQVSGLIQEMFRGAERGRAFGMFGATVGTSTAVGPLTGGLLIGAFGPDLGWRAVFFVNLPIGVAAVFLARRWIPVPDPDRADAGRPDLDPVGVVLLGGGVLGLLLPLVEGGRGGGGGALWWTAVLGAVLVLAFVLWERRYAVRGGTPLVDLGLFAVPGYTPGAVVGLVYFAGFTGVFFVLTIFLQDGLGFTALQAGLALTPFALGSALSAFVGGRLVDRFGRSLVTGGLATVLVGLLATDVILALVDGADVVWWSALPLLVAGLGSGLVISPNITLTLADVPVQRAGTAGGVLQTGQRMGTAAGIALIGAVFFATAADGDLERAAALGLRVTLGFVLLALIASIVDLLGRRHDAARST